MLSVQKSKYPFVDLCEYFHPSKDKGRSVSTSLNYLGGSGLRGSRPQARGFDFSLVCPNIQLAETINAEDFLFHTRNVYCCQPPIILESGSEISVPVL